MGVNYAWHLFNAPGDTLKLHAHKVPNLCHTTIIVRGEFDVLGSRAGAIAREGDSFEWALNEPHGLVARTANALFVNVRPVCPCDHERDYDDPWSERMPPLLSAEKQQQWLADHPESAELYKHMIKEKTDVARV